MKNKLIKNLLTGSFYFFLAKGIIWLFIIFGATLGLGRFF